MLQLLPFFFGRCGGLCGGSGGTGIGLGLLLGGPFGSVVGVHRLCLRGGGLLPGAVGVLGNGVATFHAVGQGIGGGLLLQAGLDHLADARGLLVGRLADLAQLGAGGLRGLADILDGGAEFLQGTLALDQVGFDAQREFEIVASHERESRRGGWRHPRARANAGLFGRTKKNRPEAVWSRHQGVTPA